MKKVVMFLGMFIMVVSLAACNCAEKESEKACSSEQCEVVDNNGTAESVEVIEENSHSGH